MHATPYPDGTKAIVRESANWYNGKTVTLRDGQHFPEYGRTVYIAELPSGTGNATISFALRDTCMEIVQ